MIANLFVVGPAGSGKSTFTAAFRDWMIKNEYDVITVNLDPGAETLPYNPDVDIRDIIDLSSIMNEYGLGPNGAQIVAADMIANFVEELKGEIDSYEADYVIYDTAGQIELFAFRAASKFIVDYLGGKNSILAFLFDPALAKSPSGYVSLFILSSSVYFRFYIPFINILSKVDIVEDRDLENIARWSENWNYLYDSLLSENPSMQKELSIELFKALENINAFRTLIPTSARMLYGYEDVYSTIQLTFAGGEDLEKR
ncbi:small G protein, GTPase SAR1 [Aciduliprofundum sp. MAR08-339]|uniref:PRK13768 family protein n=1 Tax=Aciduliprofundum sp. (strain MAR08-339) TaxID=673860 RepID=UPI0002A4801D|nr:small G protein, GTPase SAR1 [Aciduliprofundum sp. MAR08-339]